MRLAPLTAVVSALLTIAPAAFADTWLYVGEGHPLTWRPGTSTPSSDWFKPSYTESSNWTASPAGFGIGYGDGDDNTLLTGMAGNYLTVYVRSHFEAGAEVQSLTKMQFRARYDDAFVVWLNGTEVARKGLPPGPLAATTPASTGHDAETDIFSIELDPKLLQPGDNLLAAEVHNVSISSSDLSFIPTLSAFDTPPPDAAITRGPFVQRVGRNAATIVWQTDKPAPSRVIYGPSSAVHLAFEDATLSLRHEVQLTDLPPASPVWYQVQSATLPSPKGRFVTEPDLAETFRVVVFGDTRSNHDDHRSVVQSILPEMPQLVFHSGDLVGDGTVTSLWDKFFEIEAPMIRDAPLYPVLGNHENEAQEFFDTFVLPDDSPAPEHYYSVRWSTLLALNLDLYGSSYGASSEQYAWLDKTLADSKLDPGILHRIVLLHAGPYDSGSHGSNTTVRSTLVPLFKKHGVTMVFSGHDHDYERSTVDGIKYVVSGGGGAPLYPVTGASWTEASAMELHHVLLEFRGPIAEARVLRPDGSELDFFSVGQPGSDCSKSSDCTKPAPGACPKSESGEWACVQGACLWNCTLPPPAPDAGIDAAADAPAADAYVADAMLDSSPVDSSLTPDASLNDAEAPSARHEANDGGCSCASAGRTNHLSGWLATLCLGIAGSAVARRRRRAS